MTTTTTRDATLTIQAKAERIRLGLAKVAGEHIAKGQTAYGQTVLNIAIEIGDDDALAARLFDVLRAD